MKVVLFLQSVLLQGFRSTSFQGGICQKILLSPSSSLSKSTSISGAVVVVRRESQQKKRLHLVQKGTSSSDLSMESTSKCCCNMNNYSYSHANNNNFPPIQVFPAEQYQDLQNRFGKNNVKLIHMVRHAEGTHNVNEEYKDPINLDSCLTPKGIEQCEILARNHQIMRGGSSSSSSSSGGDDDDNNSSNSRKRNIAVITSSMTRCIQTALYSFPDLANDPNIPFIAHEGFRETVNYNCDRRRSINDLSKDFPRVDFSLLNQNNDGDDDGEDPIWKSYRKRVSEDWNSHMESAELYKVAERAWDGLTYVAQRPEPEIIICSHSAFLRCIFNFGQVGGVPQLLPQYLDDRQDKTDHKLFEYSDCNEGAFERFMRSNYDNCELRSFCFLFQDYHQTQ